MYQCKIDGYYIIQNEEYENLNIKFKCLFKFISKEQAETIIKKLNSLPSRIPSWKRMDKETIHLFDLYQEFCQTHK